jgi:TonB family protein
MTTTTNHPGTDDIPTMYGTPARLAFLILAVLTAACGGEADIEQPIPLYGDNPIEYPLSLWDQGVEGSTLLRVRVSDVGEVDSVEVAESSGHEGLDAAAVNGARQLRFQPGRKNGKRVQMWATLPVHFSTRPSSGSER